MINSMTAFARESDDSPSGNLVVEIRSVNHRYLDCSFKLPESLRALETSWRELVQKQLARGKLDCLLCWNPAVRSTRELNINSDHLTKLLGACRALTERVDNCAPLNPLELLQWPGVLEPRGDDGEALPARATALFNRALDTLRAHRAREGARLAQFIGDRVVAVSEEVERNRRLIPEILARQQDRIRQRLADLDLDGEPHRLEQELVLLAQKSDVEEELDRLGAHLEEVKRVLAGGGPCGRRLDFLMQELNREANTLSAKSIASSSTQNAVELKVLIEQMREQIQNLE